MEFYYGRAYTNDQERTLIAQACAEELMNILEMDNTDDALEAYLEFEEHRRDLALDPPSFLAPALIREWTRKRVIAHLRNISEDLEGKSSFAAMVKSFIKAHR